MIRLGRARFSGNKSLAVNFVSRLFGFWAPGDKMLFLLFFKGDSTKYYVFSTFEPMKLYYFY